MSESEPRPALRRSPRPRGTADDHFGAGLEPGNHLGRAAIGRTDANGHALRLAIAANDKDAAGLGRTLAGAGRLPLHDLVEGGLLLRRQDAGDALLKLAARGENALATRTGIAIARASHEALAHVGERGFDLAQLIRRPA